MARSAAHTPSGFSAPASSVKRSTVVIRPELIQSTRPTIAMAIIAAQSRCTLVRRSRYHVVRGVDRLILRAAARAAAILWFVHERGDRGNPHRF